MSTITETSLSVDVNGNPTAVTAPTPTSILSGGTTQTGAGSTTIITIPAGRTWIGAIGVTATAQNPPVTATGTLGVRISTVGAGVVPAASTPYVACDVALDATVTGALSGANGADNASNPHLAVVAPAGNSVTLSLDISVTGTITSLQCRGWATGELQ